MARQLGIWPNTNSVVIPSVRQSNKQCQHRDKVESQFNGSNTRCMWQGLQSFTEYKKKTRPVAVIDILLPDKLNNFFACFEDNWHKPLPKIMGSPSPWPTWVKHLRVLTLARLPAQTTIKYFTQKLKHNT
jgi:hypothetical protein